MRRTILAIATILLAAVSPVGAQVNFDSGSDGSDGALVIADSETFVLNMNLFPDGILNYTSVSMGVSSRLEVEPNADNTPLTILVQGDFAMSSGASIDVAGGNSDRNIPGMGGPGGFDGGIGGVPDVVTVPPGAGLGPGGGIAFPTSGSPIVGVGADNDLMRPSLIPLFGGSGGGGAFDDGTTDPGGGGGGGGGAILIAVNGLFSMSTASGTDIDAFGGQSIPGFNGSAGGGGGSGGAIRIMAGEILGGFSLNVLGGPTGGTSFNSEAGEVGIIRIETFRLSRNFSFIEGRGYQSLPGLVNSDGTDLSTLRISSVGGVAVPADAGANVALPDVIIPSGVSNPVAVEVTATNVTPGQIAMVRVNIGGVTGSVIEASTGPLAGTNALSTATANITMPAGVGTMAAILSTAPLVRMGTKREVAGLDLPRMKLTIDGEEVTTVERISILGAPDEVRYVTASGRSASYPSPVN